MKEKDLKIFNKNGTELCHAKKCKKHKELQTVYKGKFCKYHSNILKQIRIKLKEHANNGNTYEEMIYRRKEIELRKISDEGHNFYLKTLENRYCNQLDCYAGDNELYKDFRL
jgi:hypothetical protein